MRTLIQQMSPHAIVVFAIAICVSAYWQGLFGPLLLDDISNLGNILSSEFGSDAALTYLFSNSGSLMRPVSMLTFIINGLIGNDLFYWKLTNLAIHLCTGILVYFLATRLLHHFSAGGRLMAAMVAAIWLLHPLHVSTVLYTVQRMTELSALFVFAALLTYIIARERQQKQITSWHLQLLTWLILFPLAALSKENGLLFPAFVLLIEIFIFRVDFFNSQRLLRLGALVLAFALAVLAIKADWIMMAYETRPFTLLERLGTESRVLIAYLGMLLIPAQSRMGFSHDDFPISHGILDPWTTLPSILIIISLISIACFFRKKHPAIGFGILFFFLGHAIESTILPLELMYEHRNYLPSFGFLLAVAVTFNAIIHNRIVLAAFATTAVGLLIFVTSLRADIWSSELSLYYHMEMYHPNSERLATIKATQLAYAQQYEHARKRLDGFNSLGARIQRLNIDCLENKILEKHQFNIDDSQITLTDNYAVMQLTELANLGLDKKCDFYSESFLMLLDRILQKSKISRPNRQIVLMYRAHYLWGMKKEGEALETLKMAFSLDERNPTPLFLACEWMLDTNRAEDAKITCNAALVVSENKTFDKYNYLVSKIRHRLESSEISVGGSQINNWSSLSSQEQGSSISNK